MAATMARWPSVQFFFYLSQLHGRTEPVSDVPSAHT